MRRYYLDAELTSMLGPAYESYEGSDPYAEVSVIQASFSEIEHGNRPQENANEFVTCLVVVLHF
jgi:hypothetical protein